jgi:hypothetical protein
VTSDARTFAWPFLRVRWRGLGWTRDVVLVHRPDAPAEIVALVDDGAG